jgi:hypothetical protein
MKLIQISASLKHASPDGLYVTITPGDPSLWSGVLFIREGEIVEERVN